jgi:hypothetical protein
MAQERQPQTPRYSWQHYTKASAIFMATTATYLLARTTGAFNSLWRWNAENGAANDQPGEALQNAVARVVEPVGTEVATVATQGGHSLSLDLALTPVTTIQTAPSLSMMDWSERELPAADLHASETVETSNSNSDASEIGIIDIPSTATARRLLQTHNGTAVTSPIPNQVIEATTEYRYELSDVFSGDYTRLGASQANGTGLPTWLTFNFYPISSYAMPDAAYNVKVLNGVAYVADYAAGLQVLNITNPANTTRLGSYDTPGRAYDVEVVGNVAYVADGISGLQILNITNPANITRLGGYYALSSTLSVQVISNLAYVADLSYGLQVLNISNLASISTLGSYNTPGFAYSVQVANNTAYVADFNFGLHALNISNLMNITLLGSYDTPGYAYDVHVVDNVAYVADDTAGLQVLNVSNPANITRLGNYDTPGAARGVQVINQAAYIADLQAGLQVLLVNDPTNIIRQGSYDTPGSASSIYVANGVAYIADDTAGLQAVDLCRGYLIGTPTTARVGETTIIRASTWWEDEPAIYEDFALTVARLPQRVDTALLDRSVLPGQTLSLILNADVLFTDPTASTLTLHTQASALTVTTQLPSIVLSLNPIFLGSYDTPGQAYRTQVINGVAYVADYTSGLQILDVHNPANAIRLGNYNASDVARDVQVINGIAYVADGVAGLQVLNISNPANITRLGGYDTPGTAYGIQIVNSLAYVADATSGLQILNISNLKNIIRLGSHLILGGTPRSVQVINSIAYVAESSLGLQILDISSPTNITRLGGYDTPGLAMRAQTVKNIAYVADGTAGLQVLNVSNPANITRLGGYDTSGNAQDIQIVSDVAYIADGPSGLQVLNISNPANITRLGGYTTPSDALGVAVVNGVAYVANSDSGLQILDLTQWQLTVTPTFAEVGNYRVTVTAINELGGTASDSFELRVEGGPQLSTNVTIPQLFAKIGVPFNYFIPQGLLSDPNNDPISFSARSADNSSLPSWLSFNGISATFSGLAQSSNAGNYSLRLIATDNIPGTIDAQTVFSLYVDHLPYVNQPVADQVAGVGVPYNFTVPSSTFIDPDNGDILSYSTRQRDGSALPAWLNFDASSRRFFGTPNTTNSGSYSLVLLANDGHAGEVQSEFSLLVEHFPYVNVNQSWTVPVAGIGQTWGMTLPQDSFLDDDDTQLSYSLTRADGTNPPSWLSFNPFSGALLGVPLATDLGVNPLRVIATDPHGGSAYREFNLTVTYFPSVANAIPKPPSARVLRPFNFTIPQQTFSDLDSPTLIYDATLSTSQPLPTWLNFDAQTLTLLGTPNTTDEGTLDLLIRAQDPNGASIGAPLEVVIQPNFPPQLSTQISNQVANVLQPFNSFVPVNTFQDINGDTLNYRARLSSGGHLPGWLKFDAEKLRFHGTPSRSDTGDFGSRALDINLVAADDLSQTSTSFRINVQGDSHLLLFFKIGGPLFTTAGLAFGLYKKRSLLLNRYQKDKYQKLDHTIAIGEAFVYPLETSPELVAKVQVKLPRAESNGRSLLGFFKSSHDRLPAHRQLPTWMEYDPDKNELRSKGPVPNVRYRELIIQIKGKDDITQEEFTLKVLPATQNTLIDDDKEEHKSTTKKATVEIIEEPETTQTAGSNTTVSNNSSSWFASSRTADSQNLPPPPLPLIMDDEVELTTLGNSSTADTTFRS